MQNVRAFPCRTSEPIVATWQLLAGLMSTHDFAVMRTGHPVCIMLHALKRTKKIAYLLHFRQFVVEEPVATREDLVVGR